MKNWIPFLFLTLVFASACCAQKKPETASPFTTSQEISLEKCRQTYGPACISKCTEAVTAEQCQKACRSNLHACYVNVTADE